MQVHLTLKSANKKTGKIPVSTTSEDTCPRSCPFYGKGCYANSGPLRLHWGKVSSGERGEGHSDFLESIKKLPASQLWRHNQAGDLPGKSERINSRELKRLVTASKGKQGFTYTHKPVEGDSHTARYNRIAIRANNCADFTINLSANGVDHADKLVGLGVAPVTTVLASRETRKSFKSPEGNQVVVCPAASNDSIQCATCKLCAIHDRKTIIGFPAHGAGKRKVDGVVG